MLKLVVTLPLNRVSPEVSKYTDNAAVVVVLKIPIFYLLVIGQSFILWLLFLFVKNVLHGFYQFSVGILYLYYFVELFLPLFSLFFVCHLLSLSSLSTFLFFVACQLFCVNYFYVNFLVMSLLFLHFYIFSIFY